MRYTVKGFSNIKEDGANFITVVKLTKPVMDQCTQCRYGGPPRHEALLKWGDWTVLQEVLEYKGVDMPFQQFTDNW